MLRLLVVEGADRGQTFVLGKSSVSLGTSPDNDVCLSDPYISRHHGRIAISENQWVYQDLGSTNGSVVDYSGRQLRLDLTNPKAVLDTGCLIRLGQTVLQPEVEMAARTRRAQQHTVTARRSLADLSEAQQGQPPTLSDLLAMQELEKRLAEAAAPEAMLDMVLEALLDAFPEATHAIILLIDKKTGEPKRKAARIRGEAGRAKQDVPISMSIADRVLRKGESLLFNDVATEFEESRSAVSAGIRSSLCAPLWTGDESVGLVQVESRRGRAAFSEEDLGRLGLYASKAALGIVASELRSAESRRRRLEGLSAKLIPSFIGEPGTAESGDVRAMDASVLFSDIRGYTGTAERLSVTDTLAMLSTYHASVEDIVARHGGRIVKTPGDAILATFWKETGGRSHAMCALQCGEEILDDLPRAARAWEGMGARLEIGIGINAGKVAAGLVGKHHLEPTVVGDPVNVAQRLESATKSLQCPLIFSESVRERLPGHVEAVFLDQVTVSGREAPLRIYSLARFIPTEDP